jgi:hypothetical protein
MTSAWQTETGRLTWRWDTQRIQNNPPWMQETSEMQSGYLPALPDFASHSPFGGATWFHPHTADRDPE